MGPSAFKNYLASIQSEIGALNLKVTILVKQAESLAQKDDPKAVKCLEETQWELTRTHTKIQELKKFFVLVKGSGRLGTSVHCQCPSSWLYAGLVRYQAR
jgi:hypothetical protein